ncbi:S-layer domain containing protein [Clostridium aceticum]|uniref:S-layer domain containing protein n=1 Tax=Clostridium aceticum TaxID=84022 RepID=A0A0D8IB16_9CLOT|nr:S-layer homology domain-containing protein [Clostridium aceticum]AKL93650.1 S-layer domain containing protein [Clostridium aceticum]KJF27227.1 hypothetical protein TZ02_09190 [Clostridium aceticum]
MKSLRKLFIVVMILSTLIAATSTSFAAISFADVGANYWGRQHIEKMAGKSIVSGMDENGKRVFKPENPVSKVQALHMIFRTLRATNSLQSTANFTNKYQEVMASYNVPEWAYEAVAYSLEYEILTGGELAELMRGDQQYPATRQQVAVYLGKAIDTDPQGSAVSIITFIDRELIDATALPYVELLVGHNIISGDDKNHFNPRSTITRAQMAAICSKAYDVLEEEIVIEVPVPQPQPQPQPQPVQPVEEEKPKTTKLLGTIEYVVADTRTLLVRNEEENNVLYEIETYTEVFVDSVKRNINSLSKGQRVSLEFDQYNRLVKIEVNPQQNKVAGFIDNVLLGDLYDRIIVGGKTYRVYADAEILIKDKKATIRDLREDDSVTVHYDGERALKIVVENQNQSFTGILESGVSFTRYPYTIKVRIVGNAVRDLQIDEDTVVRRNNRRAYLDELSRGDIVNITTKDNLITRIEATSGITRTQEDEGIITSITISDPMKITILNDDDDEFIYEVDNATSIYINNLKSSISDLKLHYRVKLKLQNGVVTQIDAQKVEQGNAISGTITRINSSIDRVIVRTYDAATRKSEEVSVYIGRDTEIYIGGKVESSIRYLAVNDQVFIDGKYEDGILVATNVFVRNN